jgi:hypothetical protein
MLALRATLPGVPLYAANGFVARETVTLTMPDGVSIDTVTMERPVTPLPAAR